MLVKLIEGIGASVLALIERGDAMLGTVGGYPARQRPFRQASIAVSYVSAAYHQPYELPAGISIELHRLEPYPLLLLNPSFVLRKTFDAACRLAGVRPNVHFECSSPHTLLSLAEAGHGIAIVPSNVLLHRYDLMALPIVSQSRPLHEPLSIFWDGRRALPRYASDFCELLEGYIREVIPVGPAGSPSLVEPA
jgi:DNA-binding transcriptional LysR family regulator